MPFAFADDSNVGTVEWKKQIVSPNSFVDIIVKDDDMNKKEYPNFADKFSIFVWSDTSLGGLEIPVVETGVYSGIFKGSVYIADSGQTLSNRLVSMPGDILYAKYVDFTLPDGDTREIVSSAIVKIPGQNMDVLLSQLNPPASQSAEKVPGWVKNNAGWWADGAITDGEFVNGIQHLIKSGIISVSADSKSVPVASAESNSDSKLAALEAELEKCSEILKAYKRIDCEKPLDKEIMLYKYKTNAEHFDLGPITYHWFGVGSEGNEFEITSSGQAILSIRMLAENTSSEITAIHCTSPSICAYDLWDGSKAFKYAGMDFTSGEIVLNPGDSREFNILFGPNIGYGGTEFKYDSSKSYTFRINESFGTANIPLNLN